MKICLISPDYWGYDQYIMKTLKKKGIDAAHIKYGRINYRYQSFFHRTMNFFRKLLFGKNIKQGFKQKYVLSQLRDLGKQDKILIINPEMLNYKTHMVIKNQTSEYICYLYDSLKRNPIGNLLTKVFDRIYSFDEVDCAKYGLIFLPNYIYLEKSALDKSKKNEYSLFSISSIDERLELLNKIANQLDEMKIPYKIILSGKKHLKNLNKNLEFTKKRFGLKEVNEFQKHSTAILDLIRANQNGLSFRIFEAIALQKKIITSNPSIQEYPFYNPNNIFIVDVENPVLNPLFFQTPFEALPEEIYESYTLDTWTDKIFNLKRSL